MTPTNRSSVINLPGLNLAEPLGVSRRRLADLSQQQQTLAPQSSVQGVENLATSTPSYTSFYPRTTTGAAPANRTTVVRPEPVKGADLLGSVSLPRVTNERPPYAQTSNGGSAITAGLTNEQVVSSLGQPSTPISNVGLGVPNSTGSTLINNDPITGTTTQQGLPISLATPANALGTRMASLAAPAETPDLIPAIAKLHSTLESILNFVHDADAKVSDAIGLSPFSSVPKGPKGASELLKNLQDALGDAISDGLASGVEALNTTLRGNGVFDDINDKFEYANKKLTLLFDRGTQSTFELDSSLGLDAFGFRAKGTGAPSASFKLQLGVDLTQATAPRLIEVQPQQPLLSLDAALSINSISGDIGFLKLSATPSKNQAQALKTSASLTLGLDEKRSIKPTFNAGVDLTAAAAISSPLSTYLPSFKADLTYGLSYDSTSNKFKQKDLQISNASLSLQGLVQAAKPMVDKVKGVVEEFKPVVDFLTAPIPGLDKAKINLSILDLAKSPLFSAISGTAPMNLAFLDAITQVNSISRTLDQLSSGEINLGSLNLSPNALQGLNPRSDRFDSVLSSAFNATVDPAEVLRGIKDKLDQSLKDLPKGTSGSFSAKAGLVGKPYFEFSILDKPSSAFGLLLGDPTVDLFRFGLPGLELAVGGELSTLLWVAPPVVGSFGGSVGAKIPQLNFGYDATGLQKLVKGGNADDLFEGFYLDTKRGLRPGLSLFAELYVKGQVGFPPLFSVGAQATVRGTLDLLLNDPNADGRIRALEIASNFTAGGVGNVFDISGGVTLGFSVFMEVFALFSTERVDLLNLGPVKLLDLSSPGGRAAVPLNLGRTEGDTLRLNVGAFAVDRSRNNQDVGERVSITQAMLVSADGVGSQSFGNPSRVLADFGDGRDQLDASALGAALQVAGGLDDDMLIGGSGSDALAGGSGNDLLKGNAGNDTLLGESGADTLLGNDGDDNIQGGQGNDRLTGGTGNDYLDGGLADDILEGDAGADTALGGSGDDQLNGGNENDLLDGGDGQDTLYGGSGSDTLKGQAGGDWLEGDDGDDQLAGGTDNDRLKGGAGNDLLEGEGGNDSLEGGAGNDRLIGGVGQDLLLGDDSEGLSGNDTLLGEGGNDTLRGLGGNDSLDGGMGNDQLDGGVGNDTLTGGLGNDAVLGGEGDDTLSDTEGADTLLGGEGNDTISGGALWDVLRGGGGADQISAGINGAEIQGNDGNDRIFGSAVKDLVMAGSGEDMVEGRGGNDQIYGSTGNDRLYGDASIPSADDGNDLIEGEEGNDTLQGGGGNDTLLGGVGADSLLGDGGNDTVQGGEHNDTLRGGNGSDDLQGEDGDDTVFGEADNDTLKGGDGRDTLQGGDGHDSLSGGFDADLLLGEQGNDTLSGSLGADSLSGADGADLLSGDEHGDELEGGGGNDTLKGGDGNDVLRGHALDDRAEVVSGDGNDVLEGDDGSDELWGGDGNDSLMGGFGNDLLMGDDTDDPSQPSGKAGNDTLKGGAGNDTLFGGLGDDWLFADDDIGQTNATGFDRLVGGYGNDTLHGHQGVNRDSSKGVVFVLAPGSGKDTIKYFQSNLDANGKPNGAVSDVIQLTNGLSFGFLSIEEERRAGTWVTSLIDQDTNQVLAELIGIRKAQIGRNNIDEQNVPPDRLRLESERPVYAKNDEFKLSEAKVRDPNGAGDLEALQFTLRKPDGTWVNWHDLGLMGVANGNADFGTLANGRKYLVVSGDPVAEQADITARALELDGVDDYAVMPSFQLGGDLTIEAWVRADAANKWSRIVDIANGQGNNNILFGFYRETGRIFFEVYNGWEPKGKAVSLGTLPLGEWIHLSVVVSNDQTIKMYWNGVMVETEAIDGATRTATPPYLPKLAAPAFEITRTESWIGRSHWPLELDQYFKGGIRELKVWNNARTDEQVRSDMQNDPDPSDATLAAWYPMTGAKTNTPSNKSGTASGRANQSPLTLYSGAAVLERQDYEFERRSVTRLYQQGATGQWVEQYLDNTQGGFTFRDGNSTAAIPAIARADGLPVNGLIELNQVDSRFVDVNNDGMLDLARIGQLNGVMHLEVLLGTSSGFGAPSRNPLSGATPGAPVTWINLLTPVATPARPNPVDLSEVVIGGVLYTLNDAHAPTAKDPAPRLTALAIPAQSTAESTLLGMNKDGRVHGITSSGDGLIWQANNPSLIPLLLQGARPLGTTGEAENLFWGITGDTIFIRNSGDSGARGDSNDLTTVKGNSLNIAWPNGVIPLRWELTGIGQVSTTQQRRIIGEAEVAGLGVRGFQLAPKDNANPGGGFIATWITGSEIGKPSLLTQDGAAILTSRGEFLVNTTTISSQQRASVAALADGRFVVAWRDLSATGFDTSQSAIRAQIFKLDGSKDGEEFLVNTRTQGNQLAPSVAGLAGGGFVVVWADTSGEGGDPFIMGIKGQRYAFNTKGEAYKDHDEFLVNTTIKDGQTVPVVEGLYDGKFVVAWEDYSQTLPDTSKYAVRAQIYEANGTAFGSEFLVNTETVNTQWFISIAALTNGMFVVTWEDYSGNGEDTSLSSIRAQAYTAEGKTQGTEFLVNTTKTNRQDNPSIAALTDGGFVIAWSDFSATYGDTSLGAIRAQMYSLDSSNSIIKRGPEFVVNTTTIDTQEAPSVASLADGGFVVSWQDKSASGADNSSEAVRAQIYARDGSRRGEEILLNTTTNGIQWGGDITGLKNGGFVGVWTDFSASNDDPSGTAVRARRFDAAGRVIGIPLHQFPGTTGLQALEGLQPSITGGSNSRVVDVNPEATRLLGASIDRFNRSRGVLWEKLPQGVQVRDLGMLSGGGDVNPRFLLGQNQMLGSAIDAQGRSRAVISWDGGLLDLNTVSGQGAMDPQLTEAIGAVANNAGGLDILVNSSDGKPRQLSISGLLRTDSQAISSFSNGPAGSELYHYIARSGVGLNGSPAIQIHSLKANQQAASAPTPQALIGKSVEQLDGIVDGAMQWFALEAKAGPADDLIVMGRTIATVQDQNSDGIVDDRDLNASADTVGVQRDVLKIYRNEGNTFAENRVVLDRFALANGADGQLINVSARIVEKPGATSASTVEYGITIGSAHASTLSHLGSAAIGTTADYFILANHGLNTGQKISLAASGTEGQLPGGLESTRLYWVRRIDANSFSLHTSATSATSGSSPLTFSSSGSGALQWRRHDTVRLGTSAAPLMADLLEEANVTVEADGSLQLTGSISNASIVQQLLQSTSQPMNDGLPMTVGTTTVLWQPEQIRGLSKGDVSISDLDGDGDPDVVISGFGVLNRRTATGALVPVPEIHVYQTVQANLTLPSGNNQSATILREIPTSLPGLANGSIELADVNDDGRPDLILTGEDLFVDDNPERFGAAEQVGGNPNTSIFLNRSLQTISASTNIDLLFSRLVLPNHGLTAGTSLTLSISAGGLMPAGLNSLDTYYVGVIDPNNITLHRSPDLTAASKVSISAKGTGDLTLRTNGLAFQNAIFPTNPYDNRWASFDYRFRTDLLESGTYLLRAVPLDHGRSDVILEPFAGLPSANKLLNGTTLRGTATENLFVLANTKEDFYNTASEPVVIEGFNPFMDRIQLRRGLINEADPSQGRYTFEVQAASGGIWGDRLEILRVQNTNTKKVIAVLPGLNDPQLIKISNSFSQGNIVFADFTQAENSFILSPVDGRLRDASASTGFFVTQHGTDGPNALTITDGQEVNFDSPELRSHYYSRLLRRAGASLVRGVLTGGGGNDTLTGGIKVTSTPLPKTLPVSYLDGGAGNDTLRGSNTQSETDLLLGGDGNDHLSGLAGRNLLFGNPGDDTLLGGLNSDTLFGGRGIDVLDGGGAADTADFSQATLSGISLDLSQVNSYPTQGATAPRISVQNDGDGSQDWIVPTANYLLTTVVAGDISTLGSTLRLPSHRLPRGARIRLQARLGSSLPLGLTPGASSPLPLNGTYYVVPSAASQDIITLYTNAALTQQIRITSPGLGTFDVLGDISSIENIIGSSYRDTITGDRQSNILRGGAGDDSLDGGLGHDWLDGGSGDDVLRGGEGSDTLVASGGRDLLIGGSGDDTYILGSELLTLEQAYEALGGRLSDLAPIPIKEGNPARLKPITYEQFILLADANRWASVDGKPQFERFRALGLAPDPMLFERAKLDPSQGWLRMLPGGTRIEAGIPAYTGNDVVVFDLDQLISLVGLQPGQVGLAQQGTDLVVDVNRDGIASKENDVTIADYFRSNGTEAGENDPALRVRGLQATYYSDLLFQNIKLERVDRQIDFSWAASSPASRDLRPVEGIFSVVWDGMLQPISDGLYSFQVKHDGNEADYSYELLVDERRADSGAQLSLRASQPVRIRLALKQVTPGKPVNMRLEWKVGSQSFQVIPYEQLSTSQTVVANDVLTRSREYVPDLSDKATALGAQIPDYRMAGGWKSKVRLADFNGDGLPDLFLYGRDATGQALAGIFANRAQVLRVVDANTAAVVGAGNQLRLPAHGLQTGDDIRFEAPVSAADQLPGGVEANTTYIVTVIDNDTVTLHTTTGGAAIQLTSTGSGRWRYVAPTDRFSLNESGARMLSLSGFDELIAATEVDLDHDGDLDIVALVRIASSDGQAIQRANQLLAYRNNGTGEFTTIPLPQNLSALPNNVELRPLFADLDHDGMIDLAVAWNDVANGIDNSRSTRVNAWLTNGHNLLEASATEQNLETGLFRDGVLSAVDLTGDGNAELLLSAPATAGALAIRTLSQPLTDQDKDGRIISVYGDTKAYGIRRSLTSLLGLNSTPSKGVRFRISLSSRDFDAYLQVLEGPSGDKLVIEDDDSGPGLDSELILDSNGTTDYYLRATTYSPGVTGSFTLKVEPLGQGTVAYEWDKSMFRKPISLGSGLEDASGFAIQTDVDLDGSQEILLGSTKTSSLATVSVDSISPNPQSDSLVFNKLITPAAPADFPGGTTTSAQWIDHDNDGDLDLFLTQLDEQGPVTRLLINPVVGDPAITNFQELGTLLPGLHQASAAWSDVDGDSDLDLVLSGAQGSSGTPYLQVFRNTTVDRDRDGNRTGSQNQAPVLNLGGLKAETVNLPAGNPGILRLTWQEDFPTGEEPYTTNLRIGTRQGGQEILPSLAQADGTRLVSQAGNNGWAKARDLSFRALRPGQRHYWAVQTIDNGFLGSAFSQEESFVVNPFDTTTVAEIIPADNGLDLRTLYGGQTQPPTPNLTLAFNAPAAGFTAVNTGGLLVDWHDLVINGASRGPGGAWARGQVTGPIAFNVGTINSISNNLIGSDRYEAFARISGSILPPGTGSYGDLKLILNYTGWVRAWVDTDQDGFLESVLDNFSNPSGLVPSGTFTLPLSAVGKRPIAIKLEWGGDWLALSYQAPSQGITTPVLIPTGSLDIGLASPTLIANSQNITPENGAPIDLSLFATGLNSLPLEMRVLDSGVNANDFARAAIVEQTAAGARFQYMPATDYRTEGIEQATFQLYTPDPLQQAPSGSPNAWKPIGNAVTVQITDTSKDPIIKTTFADLDADGVLDQIHQVDYTDRSVLAMPGGRRLQLDGTNWQHQFLDINRDQRLDLLAWSPTSTRLFHGNATSASGFSEQQDISSLPGIQQLPTTLQAVTVDASSDGRPGLWLQTTAGLELWLADITGVSRQQVLNGVSSKQLISADFDADGDNDLLISTGTSLRLFRNQQSLYSEQALNLSLTHTRVISGDINSDGLLDLLVLDANAPTGGTSVRLYQNVNSTAGIAFVEQGLNALAGNFTAATLLDADHDGKLDIAASRSDGRIEIFHQQDGSNLFLPYINQPTQTLPGINRLEAIDTDADGDLDLVAFDATNRQIQLDNIVATTNIAPSWNQAATNPFSSSVTEQTVAFSWLAAEDDHTPAAGLSYRLRVGTAPGLRDVVADAAINAGADRGDGRRGWNLSGLNAGTYYWSVQAVDTSGLRSTVSPEQQLEVVPTLRLAELVTTELPVDPALSALQLRLQLPFALKAGVQPDTSEFQLSDGQTTPNALTLSSISISQDRRTLTLNLNRAVATGQNISLTYSPGADTEDDLQDDQGLRLAGFVVSTRSRNLELSQISRLAGGTAAIALQEGDADSKTVTLRLETSFSSANPISVEYEVLSDRANGDSAETGSDTGDLIATSGRLEIPANQRVGEISFSVLGDTVPEGDERFRVRLRNPAGAVLEPASTDLLVSLYQESSDGAPAPNVDLTLQALTQSLTAEQGDRLELLWDVRNLGTSSGGQLFSTEVWLSADNVADSGDRFLGRVEGRVPAANGLVRQQIELLLPADVAAGNHKLLLLTNPEGLLRRDSAPLVERNTPPLDPWTNNQLNLDLNLTSATLPDLQLVSTSLTGSPYTVGKTITLNTQVRSINKASRGGWTVKAYLSEDTILDANDVALPLTLANSASTSSVAAGGTANASFAFTLPSFANGNYQLLTVLEPAEADPNRTNNRSQVAISTSGGFPVISVGGFSDQVAPKITTPWLVGQGVAGGIRLQANEAVQLGLGNRTLSFEGQLIANGLAVDTLPPRFLHPLVEGAVLSLVMSEPINTTVVPDLTNFSVQVGGAARRITQVTLQGNNRLLLKLEQPVARGENVILNYDPGIDSPGDLRDVVSTGTANRVAPILALPVTNRTGLNDTQEPRLSDFEVRNTTVGTASLGQVSFVVSEPLSPGLNLDPNEFTLTGGASPISVRSVSIDGARVLLTLSRAVTATENALRLSYRPGADGGDDLRDSAPLWARLFRLINPATRERTLVQEISSLDVSRLRLQGSELTLLPTDGPLAGQLQPGQSYEIDLPYGFINDQAGNPLPATTVRLRTLADGADVSTIPTFSLEANAIGSNGVLTIRDHGLVTGATLQVSQGLNGIPLPAGLQAGTYIVNVLSGDTLELHRNQALTDRWTPIATGTPDPGIALLTLVPLSVPVPLTPDLRLESSVDANSAFLFRLERQGRLSPAATTFTFRLEGSANASDYTVLNGAATFNTTTGLWSATFPVGARELLIPVSPKADAIAELDETITLTLVRGAGAAYQLPVETARQSLTARILNDDAPANDAFSQAATLQPGQPPQQASNRAATIEAGEPALGTEVNSHTLWWTWQAPETGTYVISTQGSAGNTRLGLLRQAAGTNGPVALSNLELLEVNAHGGRDGAAQITVQAVAGAIYYVMVASESGETGMVQLHLASSSVRLIATDVIEGLDTQARVSVQLLRGTASTDTITVAYQVVAGTATLGTDFGAAGQSQPLGGTISFPVITLAAGSFSPAGTSITVVGHGLQSSDRVMFRAAAAGSQMPQGLEAVPYFVKVTGDALSFHRSSALTDADRVTFGNAGSGPIQMVVVERGVNIPILNDGVSEFDERLRLELTGITAGQALIQDPSTEVVISDLLTFPADAATPNPLLPADVENGLLVDGPSPAVSLTGNASNNQLFGNSAANTLNGGLGDDLLVAGSGDTLIGGLGDDRYLLPANLTNGPLPTIVERANEGTDTLLSGLPDTDLSSFLNVENLELVGGNGLVGRGTAGNNILKGGIGNDTLLGNAGDDTLEGGKGSDRLEGGPGNDTYILTEDGNLDVIIETENQGIDSIRTRVSTTLESYVNVENIYLLNYPGTGSSPFIPSDIDAIGSAADNYLSGSSGNNRLEGRGGNDILEGQFGNDTLIGGPGADKFRFQNELNPNINVDTITDFNIQEGDRIELRASIFGPLVAGQLVPATRFTIGATANTPDQRLLYNPLTGTLTYDSNGNTAGGATIFAILPTNLTTLTSNAFTVI